jgi:hypothetical protein
LNHRETSVVSVCRRSLSRVATVDDAVAILRNPAFVTANGRRAELRQLGLMEVSGVRVANELQAGGAASREIALELARQALVIVGGQDASYLLPPSKGIRAGRLMAPPRQRAEIFLVPVDE